MNNIHFFWTKIKLQMIIDFIEKTNCLCKSVPVKNVDNKVYIDISDLHINRFFRLSDIWIMLQLTRQLFTSYEKSPRIYS